MSKKKFYITTAVDYVNSRPHVGHAFEKVLADALARFHKQKGDKVFFLTGVDENAQKNVQAAENAGIDIKEFIDKNAVLFIELCDVLNIKYNKFIRTTAKEHSKVVQEIIKKIIKNGDIYKGNYEGYYCTGCETFITEKDLVGGKCPEHNKKPEFRKEEAYFFRLSKYKNKLIKFVKGYIIPEARKKEILSRLKEELKDICISRKNADWGIDFPGDKNYKIWVWVDALINYISGAEKEWPADVHVIGKGINWFHSVIWPALLMSADYKLPKKLLVHGYLNLGGKKISKSLGNVIDPIELVKKYGADSVRYSLLRCSVFEDSDYSEEILIERNNNELADKLGNLVSRVASLIEQNGVEKSENKKYDNIINKIKRAKKIELRGGVNKSKLEEDKLIGGSHISIDIFNKDGKVEIIEIGQDINCFRSILLYITDKLFENYEFDKVLNEIFGFVDACNEYVQNKRPWNADCKDRKKVLFELKESILEIARLLWPFIPETSEKITKQFSVTKIKKSEILFKKI